jgi:hypothetical protein
MRALFYFKGYTYVFYQKYEAYLNPKRVVAFLFSKATIEDKGG